MRDGYLLRLKRTLWRNEGCDMGEIRKIGHMGGVDMRIWLLEKKVYIGICTQNKLPRMWDSKIPRYDW